MESYENQQSESFIKFFGDSDLDEAGDVILAQNGDLLICGSIKLSSSAEDIWVARLDIKGNSIWQTTIKDTLSQFAKAITESSDGNSIIISSSTQKIVNGITFTFLNLTKLNSRGELIDAASYNYPFSFVPKDMVLLNNNIFVLGNKTQENDFILQSPYDIFLFKLNSQMDSIWFRTYGGSNDDFAAQLILGENNTLNAIGSTNSFQNFNQALYNILFFQTDTNGLLKDKITLGATNNDFGTSICRTNDGNYVVSGYTNIFSKNIFYSAKIQAYSHQIFWQKSFEKSFSVSPNSIITDNNDFFSVGKADFIGNSDIFLAKLDNNGDTLFFRTIGAEGNENALNAALSESGGYFIIASSELKGNQIISLLKVSPNGDFLNY
jgi:hypothetical protein